MTTKKTNYNYFSIFY